MKKTSIHEDRLEKEGKRRLRAQEYNEKHTVLCPHCNRAVLDHMTKCPHCGGDLKPVGYTPMTDKQIKKVKIITFSVGMVIAIVVLLFMFRPWEH